ncbi:MAG: hypothetical protein A2365_00505 [Candidatus Nealsonbacteria bacterium RIFOXYB1_FULL_40_15]|uniref:NAD(P)-binding domain-containing protein n=2 Tax=Candidatus Nealsoniibacteriota TaxID=1817911 RepID=A0A1G2ETN8_9BACT|nr:MAG: hypothetical protein A2365_00505 [Candidatus Nealsonbacteria bacterium RIFOXYB1_FULL_40_15]OGZ28751.1 MAG: hypothetical protein A2427_01685 [Candidatus Nealsonbacteria bacterium RIFOXYC1_FULL_40_7]OGZ29030.1 MAG: hypothetical protein A2562_00935 [Candidatus Nealsonbacteria bacterium RIFOXYD1_FULL_39_11]
MDNFWKNRNVLVTGGNGFIGGALSSELVEKGANVVVILRDWPRFGTLNLLSIERKVTITPGSVCDLDLVSRVLNEYHIDSVFHLAAQPIVSTANASPLSTLESNIRGSWIVLEACRMHSRIERIVVASSDKAYGEHKNLPYTEDMPLLGNSPYEASKACADILSRCFSNTYDLPIAVTRCANTYGGGDPNISRVIPATILKILKGEDPVIWNKGTAGRDFIYIKDAVKAYLLLGEALDRKDVRGKAFNFGSANLISIQELIKLISSLMGKEDIKPVLMSNQDVIKEIDKQFMSFEKAKKELGWEPEWTIQNGLKETIEWYKNHINDFNDSFSLNNNINLQQSKLS